MEKSDEYKQFAAIESKLYAFLNTHEISAEKSKMAISTYNYIWDLVEQHAKSKGLDTTKYLTWLILRSLAKAEYLPIRIEKCEPPTLDLTVEPKPKRLRGLDNGKRAWLKIFGTDFQRKALNGLPSLP